MWNAGYLTDVDLDHGTTLNKKIRNAQLAQYNFIFGKNCSVVLKERFLCRENAPKARFFSCVSLIFVFKISSMFHTFQEATIS